ncbi:MAG TPA: hypothetical protein VG276_06195 [Actinomycetes bacterium]|nr:hypothetical protein [Actinomycetes bacterium]
MANRFYGRPATDREELLVIVGVIAVLATKKAITESCWSVRLTGDPFLDECNCSLAWYLFAKGGEANFERLAWYADFRETVTYFN